MAFPTLSFPTIDTWSSWIDNNIIPNGMELITGNDGNITEHAAVQFIRQSPLNWQQAMIYSNGGAIYTTQPVNIFMSAIPTSLSWGDNIYNQYVFVNTTAANIPLLTGTNYYDINLTLISSIPAKSIITIFKSNNNLWILGGASGSASIAPLPPLIGVVDRGGSTDPVSGISTFQNNNLIGLGTTNNGEIQITYGDVIRSNFGLNQSFTFNNTTGTINLNYNNSGETFFTGAGLWIDRNQ